jgi:hypothetical protein
MKLFLIILLNCTLLATSPLLAAPGAHGPNGEHLDAPGATMGSANTAPRFEAQTETFEIVGRLQSGELSMLINRFATNEPVLQANVEVAFGALKSKAQFHADMGDYAIDDAAMLKALREAGEHALVITVRAGQDADLIDATLKVSAAETDGHSHADWKHLAIDIAIGAAILAAVFAIGFWIIRLRRNRASLQISGGAQ